MTDGWEGENEGGAEATSPGPWTFSLKILAGYTLLVGLVSAGTAQVITGRGFIVEWLPLVLPPLTVAVLTGAALIMNSWDR